MVSIPKDVAERLKTCTSFPSPPPVALKVIELAQNPKTDLRVVADTCSADPAIAAKIMKIANSALYASRRQSTNLRQALVVLGLNATLTLALSFTLVNGLRKDPPKGFDFMAYWRRTILAATWGKLLAAEMSQPLGEEVFISCLLQDIGMLAIDRIAPETYASISPFEIGHDKLAAHEMGALKADHAAIGAWLLNSWHMPEGLVDAVGLSHDFEAEGAAPERMTYTKIIALSGGLADAWLSGADEITVKRVGAAAEKHLNISPQRLAELFVIIQEQLPVAEDIFEMNLFDSSRLTDITDAAREILMIRNLHSLSEAVDLQKQASQLKSENIALKEENMLDGLTGVGNRRFFENSLENEFASAKQHAWPLSMCFVDLDYFKQINDTHGHQAGDDMLCAIAKMIVDTLRSDDIVARFGGDEFVVLLPGTDSAAADLVASRLVENAATCVVTVEGADVVPTLSLGVATLDSLSDFDTPKDFTAAADEALYVSKKNGRNQHTCFGSVDAA